MIVPCLIESIWKAGRSALTQGWNTKCCNQSTKGKLNNAFAQMDIHCYSCTHTLKIVWKKKRNIPVKSKSTWKFQQVVQKI